MFVQRSRLFRREALLELDRHYDIERRRLACTD